MCALKHMATRKFHSRNQATEPTSLSSLDPILPGLLHSWGRGHEAVGDLHATQVGDSAWSPHRAEPRGKAAGPGSAILPLTHLYNMAAAMVPRGQGRSSLAPSAVPGHPLQLAYLVVYLAAPALGPLMDSSSPGQTLPFFSNSP